MEVTILNEGSVRGPGAFDRLLRYSFSRGVRYFDTAAAYGTEAAFKKWFAAQPEVRKQIFLATKDGVGKPGDMVKQIDKRLAALGTDYIDLLFFHGLGGHQVDWPRSKEMKEAAEAIKKTGKVKFVGFTTHDARRPEQLQNAAEGGFIDVIMLQFSPWLDRDAPLNRAIDACHKQNIGIVSMKQMAGHTQVARQAPGAQGARAQLVSGLAHRDLVRRADLRHLRDHDEHGSGQPEHATRPGSSSLSKQAEIHQLRDAVLAAGPMMCADCDGRCGHAAGTKARLGDLTRFLTYHEHHGSRRQAARATPS